MVPENSTVSKLISSKRNQSLHNISCDTNEFSKTSLMLFGSYECPLVNSFRGHL